MKQKNYTPLYAVFHIIVWGCFGIVIGYAAPYLEAYGLTDGQYGLLLGIVSAVTFFLQLGLAELCSRLSWLTLQRMQMFLGGLMLLCCLALLFLPLQLLWLCLLFCVICAFVQVMPALVNSLGMAALDSGLSLNFGIARGIGSASFGVFSFLTGQAIPRFGVKAVPLLCMVLVGVLIVASLRFPKVSAQQTSKTESGSSLWKNRRFIAALLGATLLFISHNFLCNFFYQITVSRGGTEANQGIGLAIAAICELPVMFLFAKLLKLRRCAVWLKLSGVFMGLRALGCLLSPGVGALYASQLFQLLGFAMFSVSSAFFVNAITEPKDTVRAQSMLIATSTLSNFLTFLCGGAIVEHLGVNFLLGCAVGTATLGTVILVLFAENPRLISKKKSEGFNP